MIQYVDSALATGIMFAFFTLALNVRWGWSGDLDLSVFAYAAVGAYVAAVFMVGPSNLPAPDHYVLGLHQSFLVSLLAAMTVSGLLAFAFGAIALRSLRGDYFAITTLCFTLIVYAFISQYIPLFDGFQGITGVPQPFEASLKLSPDTYSIVYLAFCGAILLGVYLLLETFYRSPFGRGLRAIRDDELAARAFGRNIYACKLKAYVLGGVIAGLGGGLYVGFLGTWNPYAWSSSETFLLLAAILIGGRANNRGVLLGTFFIMVALQEVTRYLPTLPGRADSGEAIRFIIVGLLILAALRWRPQGVLPEPRDRDRPPPSTVEHTAPGAKAGR